MNKLLRALVCAIAMCISCWSQAGGNRPNENSGPNAAKIEDGTPGDKQQLSLRHLATVETIVAKQQTAAGFSDLVCDEDGNIYLGNEYGGEPIRKLSPKGDLATSFNLNSDSDVEVYGDGPFALSVDDELYAWVGNRKDRTYYVLVFGSDGRYKRKIKLDTGFPWAPGPFAVFKNGSLLMTGQEYDGDVRRPMLPFTAIFRPDGKLLKELSLEDDERIHKLAVERDPKLTSIAVPNSNRAVAWGHAQPAKDGNIYIMRWLSPAVIYAVSPGGEVVRRFSIDPGSSRFMPVNMHVAGNRIAILFRDEGTKEQNLKVVNLNGEELASYDASGGDSSAPFGAAFACYFGKTERFSFLATDEDHRILLRTVEPR